MRSCAVSKPSLGNVRLCGLVRGECGWEWEREPRIMGVMRMQPISTWADCHVGFRPDADNSGLASADASDAVWSLVHRSVTIRSWHKI